MSAITGICDFAAMAGSASASSCDGHATRTMSQPAAVSSAICCSVALTSAVSVVVIDCTEIGKSLPTPTLPTVSCLVFRRSAKVGGGLAGIPSITSLMTPRYPTTSLPLRRTGVIRYPVQVRLLPYSDRVHDVRRDCEQYHGSAYEDHDHRDRGQLRVVDRAAGRLAPHGPDPVADLLVEQDRDVAAVQRQER